MIHRRTLIASSVSLTAAALLPRVAAAAPLAPFKLFDSHPHFHADDLVKYPYRVDIEPARRARAVARPVTPDMLFVRWDEAEVEMGCGVRSEEHTSELQSLMRISYAVFCLKKNKKTTNTNK